MTSGFDVSIAMATFNGSRFIEAQLESLAAQEHAPKELSVVDDQSTDGTVELIERFAGRAPFPVRLRVLDSRIGPYAAFFQAVARCTADWIAFCDQDDVWAPQKLARCAAAARRRPDVLLISHSGAVVDSNLRSTRVRVPDYRRLRLVRPLTGDLRRMSPGFSQIFSRKLLEMAEPGVGPPSTTSPHGLGHDEWVALHSFALGSRLELPEALVLWRRHGGNLSGDPRRLGKQPERRAAEKEYAYMVTISRARADHFRRLASYADGDVCDRHEAAATYFDRQSSLWAMRRRAYCGRAPRRLLRVSAMALTGKYRSREHGGLGIWSLLKDGAAGIRPEAAQR
jgi:glycosyltransferase involved in cell wall biosynthesis